MKKKTQDYFTGEVHQFGKKICDIKGNYMGYMDFGPVRYFDVREVNKYYFPVSIKAFISLDNSNGRVLH